jgi:hypothetical protein
MKEDVIIENSKNGFNKDIIIVYPYDSNSSIIVGEPLEVLRSRLKLSETYNVLGELVDGKINLYAETIKYDENITMEDLYGDDEEYLEE